MEAVGILRRALLDVPGGFRGAVRVVHGEVVVLDCVYGQDGAGVAIQQSTAFQIASISKTFTAAAVLTLVDEGRLSLDDQIATWVDEAPPSWSKINVRHLLTHTSGLPHWDGVPALDQYSRCNRADLLTEIASAPLRFEPGADWSYSSLGFILLAHVAETVHGHPWASLVSERLLRPLNLHQTSVSSAPSTTTAAHGSRLSEPAPSVDLATVNLGTGDIWSTAGDLARWPRALAAADLLRPTTLQQMLAPQAKIADQADGPRNVSYGYGWFIARYSGTALLFHPGDQTGFSSLLLWAPERDLTLVVLSADEVELAPLILPAFERLLDETRHL